MNATLTASTTPNTMLSASLTRSLQRNQPISQWSSADRMFFDGLCNVEKVAPLAVQTELQLYARVVEAYRVTILGRDMGYVWLDSLTGRWSSRATDGLKSGFIQLSNTLRGVTFAGLRGRY